MSSFYSIKQLEEKNVANEIDHMVWSDRMDLVAYSNIKGDVALHRLTWTRAWNINPPSEGVTVSSIVWRPDGKLLAVAYSSGKILLVSVENKESLANDQYIEETVSCMVWVQEKRDIKQKDVFNADLVTEERNDPNSYTKYNELSKIYVSHLPSTAASLDASNSATEAEPLKSNFLHYQNELNFLLIGTKCGLIYIKLFGCLTCCVIDIKTYLDCACSIEQLHLSEDLSKLFVTIRNSNNIIDIIVIDSTILKSHNNEFFELGMKYISLTDFLQYISNTLTNILETWENFLLEIDNNLLKYALKVPSGGVTADFLDLLMFGICSNEMEEFLVNDLTKKGLEKFGQNIEMSYNHIQLLLLKNILISGQNITYHLSELRGTSRLENRYKMFGLSENLITKAMQSTGAFLIKAGEMQQIINHSIINYKAFFRWLYTAIMHLMDESIPSDMHRMTQQELSYITEFLQNFDNIGVKNKPAFILERLGQYLFEVPLHVKSDMNGNKWTNFLLENECVHENQRILKQFSDMSFKQHFKHLQTSVDDVFNLPKTVIVKHFKALHVFHLFENDAMIKSSSVNLNNEITLFSFATSNHFLYMLQIHVGENHSCQARNGRMYFEQFLSYDRDSQDKTNYQILDIKFYSTSILSILLKESNSTNSILFQLSIAAALEKLSNVVESENGLRLEKLLCVNGSNLMPKVFKSIEGMVASRFAVSGSRRVCIVLSENKRKVKLFEMEGEEDEDEDADMSNCMHRESDITISDTSSIVHSFQE